MRKMKGLRLVCLIFLLSGCDKNFSHPKNDQPNNAEVRGLLISEILPDPHKGSVEFVEIYNNSADAVNLNTIHLATTNSTGKRSKLHPVSATDLLLHPLEYKLLSSNSKLVQTHYSFVDTLALHTMASFPTLTNSNGAVIIFQHGNPVDSLYYTAAMHDPFIKNAKGVSLERVSFALPTNATDNFISAAATPGYATPGYRNSQATPTTDNVDGVFLSSTVFSPGKDEKLTLNFTFKHGAKMANIIVFNGMGKEVRTLLQNHRLGTNDIIFWDGLDNTGKNLPTGIYYLSIEIYDSNGYLKTFKKSCVLAKT